MNSKGKWKRLMRELGLTPRHLEMARALGLDRLQLRRLAEANGGRVADLLELRFRDLQAFESEPPFPEDPPSRRAPPEVPDESDQSALREKAAGLRVDVDAALAKLAALRHDVEAMLEADDLEHAEMARIERELGDVATRLVRPALDECPF